jgi:hypothetical protein
LPFGIVKTPIRILGLVHLVQVPHGSWHDSLQGQACPLQAKFHYANNLHNDYAKFMQKNYAKFMQDDYAKFMQDDYAKLMQDDYAKLCKNIMLRLCQHLT